MTNRTTLRIASLLVPVALMVACGPEDLSPEERAQLAAQQAGGDFRPAPSPTNAVANDGDAVALGRALFVDRRMSADGRIACASCHRMDQGLSDNRQFSVGVFGREGGRHSLPAHSLGLHRFYFWDGRADSAWSQPLQAIEAAPEMDFSRAEVAHFVAQNYASEYAAVFGPLPDLSGVPARAKPGDDAWDALSENTQQDVERVFSNVGKSLEAFERTLTCTNTRFDRWSRGEVTLSAAEERGAAAFVRERCNRCHAGPGFTDGRFHNLGLEPAGSDDRGRQQGLDALFEDPFNGVGIYSDDPEAGEAKLVEALEEIRTLGAFRTPTLRGVTQRQRWTHHGVGGPLPEFLRRTYNGNNGDRDILGQRDPLLRGVNAGRAADDLAAFLGTLSCPDMPAGTGPNGPPERDAPTGVDPPARGR